ncbi:lipocalin family protein [Psychroflexus aestuariivivens]|uniref:lipocalin family protein n=1 Tax=Psychroflexus aestuariivivens TaxID=1795040 RepID=UPI000FD7F54A|nr:lipocalin family protein [Psychroflexus aestuariivivens]
MKNRLSSLLILLLAVVLTSCESNDDTATINGEIGGEWNIESINYTGTTIVSQEGNSVTTNLSGESFDENATMTFNEADNLFSSQGSYFIELTSSNSGQTQTQTIPINDYYSEGEWDLDGNILTVAGGLVSISSGTPVVGNPNEIQSQEYVVEELTATTMVISGVDQQLIQESDIELDVTIDFTITLTK